VSRVRLPQPAATVADMVEAIMRAVIEVAVAMAAAIAVEGMGKAVPSSLAQ